MNLSPYTFIAVALGTCALTFVVALCLPDNPNPPDGSEGPSDE